MDKLIGSQLMKIHFLPFCMAIYLRKFSTSRKDRYQLKCELSAHPQQYDNYDTSSISGGVRCLNQEISTEALKFLVNNISFIDIWLKYFQDSYIWRYHSYQEGITEVF